MWYVCHIFSQKIPVSTLSQRVSPSLTRDQGEIRVHLLRLIIKDCEKEIRLRVSLDTFIKDQKQLFTRTQWTSATRQLSTRDVNQTRSKLKPQSSRLSATSRRTVLRTKAPSERSFHGGKRDSRSRRIQDKPKTTSTRPEGRSSTSQGKDNNDKTSVRTVTDTTTKEDDK